METVEIWTDGACEPNPGRGGWGAVLSCNGHYKELSGGEPETTNNRMELRAAAEGLKALKQPGLTVRIYSDSQYLVNTMNGNYSKGKNLDLWPELESLARQHTVKWIKVRREHPKLQRPHVLANRAIRTPLKAGMAT